MKRILILALLAISLQGCNDARVEQDLEKDEYPHILCGNSVCYRTLVWAKGNIVASWRDNSTTITDSLRDARKKEGNRIIHAVSPSYWDSISLPLTMACGMLILLVSLVGIWSFEALTRKPQKQKPATPAEEWWFGVHTMD